MNQAFGLEQIIGTKAKVMTLNKNEKLHLTNSEQSDLQSTQESFARRVGVELSDSQGTIQEEGGGWSFWSLSELQCLR